MCHNNINYTPLSLMAHHRQGSIHNEAVLNCIKSRVLISLDRIDLQIEIVPLTFDQVSRSAPGEPSTAIRERVIKARRIQEERYKEYKGIHCNAQMTTALMREYATPLPEDAELLRLAMNRFQLSARAYDRILRVARTIADLAGSERITSEHLSEAIGYRNMDRATWGE